MIATMKRRQFITLLGGALRTIQEACDYMAAIGLKLSCGAAPWLERLLAGSFSRQMHYNTRRKIYHGG
jgi:hypothetical protein